MHTCTYSKAMNQPYPRLCIGCGKPEPQRTPPGGVKPISPDEVGQQKTTQIPGEVFAAFNEVIAKHWSEGVSEFTQDEVLANIVARMPSTQRHEVLTNRWLDVEDSYRAAGWIVDYEKPGYNESGSARFTFKRRIG